MVANGDVSLRKVSSPSTGGPNCVKFRKSSTLKGWTYPDYKNFLEEILLPEGIRRKLSGSSC